ncbi:cysteine synthase [Desulfobotulus alkaliphilus]|uniref:cysteine synthase n=1 Tax=Desulfobotulus alkaliphilus TaxID=622671 RepID=A0A562RS57_9BACT|nr:cysteine synthase A [Desulfobotulus alkaliphilus]TWI71116.1 cysteine synthase [Desulfobotulus alkaliphilus]
MNIYPDIPATIGRTPMVDITPDSMKKKNTKILAKLEFFNPLGSVKDRIAEAMLSAAEKKGQIGPGSAILEPTSGNTGIALAAVCAARGYRLTLTMPESMSLERKKLLRYLGAELILTPAAAGMAGAIEKAHDILSKNRKIFMPDQFSNPANPAIHEKTTAPEMDAAAQGHVHALVAGVGTGGTLTGIGRYFKRKNPDFKVVAVEPSSSPVLSGGSAGTHKIQGIGAGFIPAILDTALMDEVIPVRDEEAMDMAKWLARSRGILCGISSGAAVSAAMALGERAEFQGKTIVTILPSTGERYLSTALFDDVE